MTDLAAFKAAAKAKQEVWHAERRAYVTAAAGIISTMTAWPIRKPSEWRIKPPPGTIDDVAAD